MSETTLKTRREFLKGAALGGALSWTIPSFLAHSFSSLAAGAAKGVTGKDGTILVVLQLAGGNDGLNTVVPFTNDYYRKARPGLAIPASAVLKLNDSLGLHPSLEGFKALYDAGQVAVYQGVGYPNPNRSHFRSTEIWHTASDAKKVERYGWIGRYFDNACRGADPTVGVAIGRQMPQAFASPRPAGVSLENPDQYRQGALDEAREDEMQSSEPFFRKLNDPEMDSETSANSGDTIGALNGTITAPGSALDFLERAALDAQVSSDKIMSIARKGVNTASYPSSQLANNLKLVSRLIGGGLPTRIFYLSQGGFDTHTNQAGSHERLLRELGGALRAFMDDMRAQGNLDRVMVLTFSEFGRRLAQNANSGTDHGAAAPMFLCGGKVNPGIHGQLPSLAPGDLHNGDPRFSVDFRSIYAGVLEQWLQTPSAPALGQRFNPIKVV